MFEDFGKLLPFWDDNLSQIFQGLQFSIHSNFRCVVAGKHNLLNFISNLNRETGTKAHNFLNEKLFNADHQHLMNLRDTNTKAYQQVIQKIGKQHVFQSS